MFLKGPGNQTLGLVNHTAQDQVHFIIFLHLSSSSIWESPWNLIKDHLKWHFPRIALSLSSRCLHRCCIILHFYNIESDNTSSRAEFPPVCVLRQGHSKTWMFHTINPRPLIRSFVERSNNDDNSSEKYKTETLIRFRELWLDPGGG